MRNGLYKVNFRTPMGEGIGIITLLDGKVRGGDLGLFYVGTYQEKGEDFTAEVLTGRHTNQGVASVFGTDVVHISLTGRFSGNTAQLGGTARERPGVAFTAHLAKIAE